MSALVLGSRGLVGSAIVRRLRGPKVAPVGYDLRTQVAVDHIFHWSYDQVYLAAARVGGIRANSERPAEFISDNLRIQTNVIDAAYRSGAKKLLFLGSSCIYPKLSAQPIREDALLTGPLEPTNSAYAVAKIAGIEMCKAYRAQYGFNAICAMPTNLYGPGDKFNDDGHVIPGLIRRIHDAYMASAPVVTVWGSGRARREFLHVDDMADAAVFLMEKYDESEPINVGCGVDVSIAELAHLIASIVGYSGRIEFDPTKPDGTPRKLLDVTKITELGWNPKIGLVYGLKQTYEAFCQSLVAV